jgi:hypothetical protein
MKRKIAICLYGLPREIEICKAFNTRFFEQLQLEPYFFCHTWLTEDYKFKKTYNDLERIKKVLGPVIVEQHDPVEYINKYCEDKNIDIDSNTFRDITHAGCRQIGQFLSLERCIQLLEENEHKIPNFDIVLIQRYDVIFKLDRGDHVQHIINTQINDIIENPDKPIIYQPLIDGALIGGYPQASCYYFLTNRIGASTFAENFGYNIITTYKQKNNPNRLSYFDGYLYDKKANGVRNKHAFFFQQYINNVQASCATHHIKHLVVRHTCTEKDSWEDIQRKFI